MSRPERYGITDEQFSHMQEIAAGVCAICHRRPPKGLVIDHCHTTGLVRGLICNPCNLALGIFEDDTSRMIRAVAYLGQRSATIVADQQYAYARQEYDRYDYLIKELSDLDTSMLHWREAAAHRAAVAHAERLRRAAEVVMRQAGRVRAAIRRNGDDTPPSESQSGADLQ